MRNDGIACGDGSQYNLGNVSDMNFIYEQSEHRHSSFLTPHSTLKKTGG